MTYTVQTQLRQAGYTLRDRAWNGTPQSRIVGAPVNSPVTHRAGSLNRLNSVQLQIQRQARHPTLNPCGWPCPSTSQNRHDHTSSSFALIALPRRWAGVRLGTPAAISPVLRWWETGRPARDRGWAGLAIGSGAR